jgi:hypothetical protein
VSTSIFLKMAENNFVRQKRPGRIVNLLSKTSSGDRSGLAFSFSPSPASLSLLATPSPVQARTSKEAGKL